VLEPHVSNHGRALVYFSEKRENVLVYLSNAVEKLCRETAFPHEGAWTKWGPYGFDKDGILRLEEYYPDALEETYRGVSGFIYRCGSVKSPEKLEIPFAAVSSAPVKVTGCEVIPDALRAITQAEVQGLIRITRYHELSDSMRRWIEETIRSEYAKAQQLPEYRCFLEAKFAFLK